MDATTRTALAVELLQEGYFLVTSADVPGLIAQGRTLCEAMAIARDVEQRLAEARAERASTAH